MECKTCWMSGYVGEEACERCGRVRIWDDFFCDFSLQGEGFSAFIPHLKISKKMNLLFVATENMTRKKTTKATWTEIPFLMRWNGFLGSPPTKFSHQPTPTNTEQPTNQHQPSWLNLDQQTPTNQPNNQNQPTKFIDASQHSSRLTPSTPLPQRGTDLQLVSACGREAARLVSFSSKPQLWQKDFP